MERKIKKTSDAVKLGFDRTKKALIKYVKTIEEEQPVVQFVLDADFFDSTNSSEKNGGSIFYIVRDKLSNDWKKHAKKLKTKVTFLAGYCVYDAAAGVLTLDVKTGKMKQTKAQPILRDLLRKPSLTVKYEAIATENAVTEENFLDYDFTELKEDGAFFKEYLEKSLSSLDQFNETVLVNYQNVLDSKKSKSNFVLDEDLIPKMEEAYVVLQTRVSTARTHDHEINLWKEMVDELSDSGLDETGQQECSFLKGLREEVIALQERVDGYYKKIALLKEGLDEFMMNAKLLSTNNISEPNVSYPNMSDPYAELLRDVCTYAKTALTEDDVNKMEALLEEIKSLKIEEEVVDED